MIHQSYLPPTKLKPQTSCINILQLTDLHLPLDRESVVAGINLYSSFEKTLNHIIKESTEQNKPCDLILLTGDLVNDINPKIYDYIFNKLTETGIPFACISGNHDVTDVVNKDAPFEQRQHIACVPDARLLNRHVIEADEWQILLIDSSVAGKVHGKFKAAEQAWLIKQLTKNKKPALIVMHHHALPIQSKWMDKHIMQNANEFWATIGQFTQVKAVLSGHTHQASEQIHQGIIAYTTPSTGYQYKPKQDEFAYDEQVQAGYRWLFLQPDGAIKSEVKRIS